MDDTTQVLVLNAAYQPLGTILWRDAFTKLYAEDANQRVEIVSAYKDKTVRSAHAEFPMPCVVRHVKFNKAKNAGIRFSKENVWIRDRGRCQYCGLQVSRKDITLDHVIPKSRGGQKTFENIVVACAGCNGRKRDQTPAEARMKLLTLPRKPDYLPIEMRASLRYHTGMPKEWRVWFKGEYWHGGTEESEE